MSSQDTIFSFFHQAQSDMENKIHKYLSYVLTTELFQMYYALYI